MLWLVEDALKSFFPKIQDYYELPQSAASVIANTDSCC